MKRINSEKLLHIIYESYKRILKEKEEAQTAPPKPSFIEPIVFNPSFYKGKYYFNVTIKDRTMFNSLSNFSTDMAKRAMRSAIKRKMPFTEKDFNKIQNTYRVTSSNGKLDDQTQYIILKVPIDHPEKLLNEDGKPNWDSQDIKKIRNMLSALKKDINIDDSEIQNAFQTMFHYFNNKPTKENEEQVAMETQKLFFQICQTLGDDKTKRLLHTIQITDEGFVADHQYSLHNKLRIIAQATIYDQNGSDQLNTISYLATPRQWRKMGRRVIDFSHPYYTVTFNGGKGSQEDEIEFAKTRGLQPMRTDENKSNGVGYNAGKGLNAAVNADLYGRKSFSYNDAIYDVQATEVIGGAQDKFSEEPGMKNNLTGELNDVARQKMGILSDTPNQAEKDDRTKQLNDMFGTTNYEGVNLTYQATCVAAGVTPNITNNGNVKAMIKESGSLIDKMLIKKLQGFKDGEGHIARPENYLPLVPIGRIIIQAIIGLPMDDAPAIQWVEEHQQVANALSSHVHSISNKILHNKRKLMNIQGGDITEMINIYSPMFVFEETFNNALNLLEANAKK
jgi:hypothetical protein